MLIMYKNINIFIQDRRIDNRIELAVCTYVL